MCPILKENRNRYPANWSTEIVPRIRERSGGQCEKCGAINHSWVNRRTRELCLSDEDEAIRVVLTVAHLDHQPENCSDENLLDWCQKCHNSYDSAHRRSTRKQTQAKGNLKIQFT